MASATKPSSFDAFVGAAAGASGGVFAAAVLMPMEVAKTRISVSQGGQTSLAGTIKKILDTDGIQGLYCGLSTKCCEKATENFVFFYVYEAIKSSVQVRMHITNSISLGLGFISGVVTMTTISPLEVLSTKLQVGSGDAHSPFTLLKRILSEEGVAGLYKGYWFNFMLCINPALQNTFFDKVKDLLLERRSRQGFKASLTALEALFVGATAKAVATLATYPLTRVKTMLQAGKEPTVKAGSEAAAKGERSQKRRQTPQLIRSLSFSHDKAPEKQVLLERFLQLYRGVGPTLLKGVLQAALMYMAKDKVQGVVVKLLRALVKPNKMPRIAS
eukprot:TRINITY_DN23595_c0_g1_i1.p1 TRINITY_DN23595_c0_g1~~TRINITY_DN23595_c0_g1_i1.p1  ORF type:complete len:356 (-),score=77.55 TRINITY_DN23595_c0_g1_i1:24-1013(-)